MNIENAAEWYGECLVLALFAGFVIGWLKMMLEGLERR